MHSISVAPGAYCILCSRSDSIKEGLCRPFSMLSLLEPRSILAHALGQCINDNFPNDTLEFQLSTRSVDGVPIIVILAVHPLTLLVYRFDIVGKSTTPVWCTAHLQWAHDNAFDELVQALVVISFLRRYALTLHTSGVTITSSQA